MFEHVVEDDAVEQEPFGKVVREPAHDPSELATFVGDRVDAPDVGVGKSRLYQADEPA